MASAVPWCGSRRRVQDIEFKTQDKAQEKIKKFDGYLELYERLPPLSSIL
jgi:hypothetical protein